MTEKRQAEEMVGLEGSAKKKNFRRLWVEKFSGPVGNTRKG
jgi:hypothetical protein